MRKIIILLASFLLISTLFMTNNVKGASGDVTLSDWDDVASGLDTGNSGYFDFKNTGVANRFETSTDGDLSAPNSFKVYGSSSNIGKGYWNLTSSFPYISSINITFDGKQSVTADDYMTMYFYDSDGNNHIKFKLGSKLWWYSVSGTYEMATVGNGRYYLTIEHNGTNQFHIELLNSSFDVQASSDNASFYAGDYTNFSSIYSVANSGGATVFFVYFDDIIINTESSGETGIEELNDDYCSTEIGGSNSGAITHSTSSYNNVEDPVNNQYIEVMFKQQLVGNITGFNLYIENIGGLFPTNYVTPPAISEYTLYCNGISCGQATKIESYDTNGYVIKWVFGSPVKLENENPLFSIKSSHLETNYGYWKSLGVTDVQVKGQNIQNNMVEGKTHNSASMFIDSNFNGDVMTETINHFWSQTIIYVAPECCYIYESDAEQQADNPIDNDTLNDMKNESGDVSHDYMFIEFDNYKQSCEYRVNTKLNINYYVTITYLETGVNFYKYVLYDSSNNPLHTGIISVPFNKSGIREEDYTFTSTGDYYMILYNTTDDGFVLGSIMDYSASIKVCPADASTDDDGGIDEFNFATIPVFFRVILALLIIIIITITPYALISLINRGRTEVELPSLVYVAFFFIGIGASVMLGFLEAWVFFIVFFGLILTIAILWIKGKSDSGGE